MRQRCNTTYNAAPAKNPPHNEDKRDDTSSDTEKKAAPLLSAAPERLPVKPRLLGTVDGETLFLILLVYLLITEKSDTVLIAALVYILI